MVVEMKKALNGNKGLGIEFLEVSKEGIEFLVNGKNETLPVSQSTGTLGGYNIEVLKCSEDIVIVDFISEVVNADWGGIFEEFIDKSKNKNFSLSLYRILVGFHDDCIDLAPLVQQTRTILRIAGAVAKLVRSQWWNIVLLNFSGTDT